MEKRIALVTGAVKGIGKAITDKFIADEYIVIAVDVDEKNGKKLISQYGKEKILFAKANISNEKTVRLLFEKILKKYGHIDVLVNNAGIIRDNMIWNMPSEDFDLVMNINLKGVWLMCRGAAKLMREQKYGRIVN